MGSTTTEDLASELGIEHAQLISFLADVGINVQNHRSGLAADQVALVRALWEREKRQQEKGASLPEETTFHGEQLRVIKQGRSWAVEPIGDGWVFEKTYPTKWKAELALETWSRDGRVSDYWKKAQRCKEERKRVSKHKRPHHGKPASVERQAPVQTEASIETEMWGCALIILLVQVLLVWGIYSVGAFYGRVPILLWPVLVISTFTFMALGLSQATSLALTTALVFVVADTVFLILLRRE